MRKNIFHLLIISVIAFGCSANQENSAEKTPEEKEVQPAHEQVKPNAVAYFASGCFWCVEAIFEAVIGVGDVISGYSGGKASTASYDLVSAGTTNHAEAVAVHYDSTKIDYPDLLKVFFGSHDPTTLNRQGPDRGEQYRSAIFYRNKKEKKLANNYVDQLLDEDVYSKITTEVVPFDAFYEAEDYHQNYEARNPSNAYIQNVSIPRLKRFQEQFPELLKASHK